MKKRAIVYGLGIAILVLIGVLVGLRRLSATRPFGFTSAPKGVVIEVSGASQSSWHKAIYDLKSLHKDFPSAKLALVALATGVSSVTKQSPIAGALASDMSDYPVSVYACHRAMNAFQIRQTQLLQGVRVVPIGKVQVQKLEDEGYKLILLS